MRNLLTVVLIVLFSGCSKPEEENSLDRRNQFIIWLISVEESAYLVHKTNTNLVFYDMRAAMERASEGEIVTPKEITAREYLKSIVDDEGHSIFREEELPDLNLLNEPIRFNPGDFGPNIQLVETTDIDLLKKHAVEKNAVIYHISSPLFIGDYVFIEMHIIHEDHKSSSRMIYKQTGDTWIFYKGLGSGTGRI